MASIVFALAGSALGSSLGLGAVGSALVAGVGGLVGNSLDNALLGVGRKDSSRRVEALQTPTVIRSAYGEALPVVYGSARVAGTILWMAAPRVTTETQTQKVRTGKFSSKTVTTAVDRITETDLAVALTAVPSLLAETRYTREASEDGDIVYRHRGGLVGVRRIWMDSALVFDARTHNTEPQQVKNFVLKAVYDGREDQLPDETIEAAAGLGNVPAFRGLAWLLLENLRISDYGNRIPNITAEVVASLPRAYVEETPEALALAPNGFVYAVCRLRRTVAEIHPGSLIVNQLIGRAGALGEYLGTLKSQPQRIAAGADGHLWITCQGDACVQRLNPTTGAVVATIPTGYYPGDIVLDAAGNPWVSFPTLDKVARINPATNTVAAEYSVAGAPWRMAVGAGNDLWITTHSHVVRLNRSTGVEVARVAVGLLPCGVAVNPVTGLVWTALSGEDVIKVIDPASNMVVKIRNTGTYPTAVSCHPADPHGSMAVTLLYGNQLKVYSRTYSEMLEYGTVAFPGDALHLPGGKVFVTQARYDFVLMAEGR